MEAQNRSPAMRSRESHGSAVRRGSSDAAFTRETRQRRTHNIVAPAVLTILVLLLAATPREPARLTPVAAGQTQEVAHSGDAADDPAIWVHPTDASRSVIFGTDKQGGLNAYSLAGALLECVGENSRPNNVDVLYDFPLAGEHVDLALATTRGAGCQGVKIWTIGAQAGRLGEVGPGVTFSCFDGGEPYGLCAYRSPSDGCNYVFVTNKQGQIEQYLLAGDKHAP